MITVDVITPAGTVGMPATYADVDAGIRAFLDTIPRIGNVSAVLSNTVIRCAWQGQTVALGLFEPSPSGGRWPTCVVTSCGGFCTYVVTRKGWVHN